jgi:hypothetical protein
MVFKIFQDLKNKIFIYNSNLTKFFNLILSGWTNPPFNLIGKVLAKARQERANLTVIAPIWSTAPWFPTLLNMSVTWPILLSNQKDLFLPGFLGNSQPLNNPNWRAAAFNISRIQSSTKEFQIELSRFFQEMKQELTLINPINLHGLSLLTGSTSKAILIGLFHQIDW